MKVLRKPIIAAAVVGTIGTGLLGVGAVANAESGTTATSSDPMSSLVSKIASTFNLDKTKVQQVFDQERTEREAAHEQEITTKLTDLVSKGTITAAQKSAIETKLAEMKKEREADKESHKSMTEDERKADREAKKTALESWATSEGLDLTKLDGIFGPGGGPRKDS